ncbi:MAG: hypothetical protein ACOCV2_12700, partial [Persicimonas sp.]
GQPVAFLNVSQLPNYIKDFKNDPELMAQFMTYSPSYQAMAASNSSMEIDLQNPQFPEFDVEFKRTGLLRSTSTSTPSIYRIEATGQYGSSQTEIVTVVDFDKSVRRMPDEEDLEQMGMSADDLAIEEEEEGGEDQNDTSDQEGSNGEDDSQALGEALDEARETMPKGRVLYWREN